MIWATTILPSSHQTAGPSTRPSPTSSGRIMAPHCYIRLIIYLTKQRPFIFILQEEYSEIPWSRERYLYSEGHAETRGYHPLCFRPSQHHKYLRKSLSSFAICIPHEEPASQTLCHCRKLRDPVEQQLWTRDWFTWFRYQVLIFFFHRTL